MFLFLFLFFSTNVYALADTSKSAILMDMDTGRVLYEKNIHDSKLIASTTKIMTAVLAIESNRLDEIVTIDASVQKAYGSNIYLEMYEKITLRDLVYGLILRSGNDAAMVIANYISSSEEEFAKKMNEKAKRIGMNNTIFHNASGLDDYTENRSTAYDMALLQKYAMALKEYQIISKTKKYVTKSDKKDYVWTNKNKLLKMYKYATSGKPGFTSKANRTLVTSASKGGMNLIVVTLNDDTNDFNQHKELYEYGFKMYTNYKILDKKTFEVNSPHYLDKLYIKDNFYYPLTNEEKNQIAIRVELEEKKYRNKEDVGDVIVLLNEQEITRMDVYVSVKEKEKSKLISWIEKVFHVSL